MQLVKELGTKSWINSSGKKDSKTFGLFLCPSCNKEVEKPLSQGKSSNSCGDKECRKSTFRANPNNKGNTKHGLSLESNIKSFYRIYDAIIQRCYNHNHKSFENYGAKGIIVCDRWLNRDNFVEDMYEEYNEMYKKSDGQMRNKPSIDRIDPFGNYEPSNCKWIRFGENSSKDKMIPILRLDFDDNILETYESMTHAAEVFSIQYGCKTMKAQVSNIWSCCNGISSDHLGYRWAFATNKIRLQKTKI